ncbi:hypothetical protein ACS0TY_020158 [Phlomoides rotata]
MNLPSIRAINLFLRRADADSGSSCCAADSSPLLGSASFAAWIWARDQGLLSKKEDIWAIFGKADKDNSGTLTVMEFQEVLDDICERYPQVELYLKNRQMHSLVDLLKYSEGDAVKESVEVNLEEFKSAFSQVDSQMKNLPATAQPSKVHTLLSVSIAWKSVSKIRKVLCGSGAKGVIGSVLLGLSSNLELHFENSIVQAFWTICSSRRGADGCAATSRLGLNWPQLSVALVICICQFIFLTIGPTCRIIMMRIEARVEPLREESGEVGTKDGDDCGDDEDYCSEDANYCDDDDQRSRGDEGLDARRALILMAL